MKVVAKVKSEASVSAKVIKKDGTVIDLGKICYTGPWYKVLFWKLSRIFTGASSVETTITTDLDLGTICYTGSWYRVLLWKISSLLRRRGL